MKIQVIEVRDLENGGAEVIIDIDEETKKFLINEGFISVLLKGTVVVKELWDEKVVDEK
jgi:hypothetical protein